MGIKDILHWGRPSYSEELLAQNEQSNAYTLERQAAARVFEAIDEEQETGATGLFEKAAQAHREATNRYVKAVLDPRNTSKRSRRRFW